MSSDSLNYVGFIAFGEDDSTKGTFTLIAHTSRSNIDEDLELFKGIAATSADANFHS